MGVGTGAEGANFSAKKVVFLVFSGKNQISPFLAPPWKNPFVVPLEKILPTTMHTVIKVLTIDAIQK